MDAHRLQDKADARRLLREARQEEAHQHRGPIREAADVKAPSGAGSAALVGDDGRIELDPAEIAAADAELGRRYDELSDLLTRARNLEAPLRDGTGPVSAHLRKAFGVRGSSDSGVQAVLRDYLAELDGLRQAIRQAAAGHEAHEAEVGDTLTALHRDGEAEA